MVKVLIYIIKDKTMSKKLFGINMEVDLKDRLDVVAKKKAISSSSLISQVLLKFVNEYEEVKEREREVEEKQPPITEEQRLAAWEWRKSMVVEGKIPISMGNEYPSQSDLDSSVYATHNKLSIDCGGIPNVNLAEIPKKIDSTQTLTDQEF